MFSFGSTGELQRQIAERARFDALAAANGSCADDAVKSCECLDGSKVLYAAGRIAFFRSTGGRTLMQKDGVLLPAESRPPPEPAEARP